MLRPIYTLLICLLAPLVLAFTAWRGIRDPAYRDRLGERLGYTRLRFARPAIWVHAVSMGEVQAAAPLIRELRRRYPDRPLLVTTATPTGAARVKALFADTVSHAYLPYDTPGSVRRFLDRVSPCVAIVMETEVWPNLYGACARRGIPIVMASARLSERSIRRLRWLGGLFQPVLAANVTIAAQTQADADRFVALGADRARVPVVGNLKFDVEIASDLLERGRAVREAQFARRFVWVAGSTHEGEEQIVVAAHELLRAKIPEALLLLVPRHPQRFATVRQWLESQSLAFTVRSSGAAVAATDSILLVDTLGELLMFYAAADVAFVGGSLVPIGGHNLLEPAALSQPVLAGPNNDNARDIAALLFSQQAALQVGNANELSVALIELAGDAQRRHEMGARGARIVSANRGALAKVLTLVAPYVTNDAGKSR
jgi:3-deoxy-D-manno-octulosonic-acid transferase